MCVCLFNNFAYAINDLFLSAFNSVVYISLSLSLSHHLSLSVIELLA